MVVISNNVGNEHSSIVTVVPVTSTQIRVPATQFEIHLRNVFGTVRCEQIQTISQDMMGDYVGCLTRHYTKKMEECVLSALNLNGSVGQRYAPEEGRLYDQQVERIEAIRQRYEKEVELLAHMIGYEKEQEQKEQQDDKDRRIKEEVKKTSSMPESKRRKYIRRTKEEIALFIEEWEDPYNKKEEVAEAFKFSNKTAAGLFYSRHKKGA